MANIFQKGTDIVGLTRRDEIYNCCFWCDENENQKQYKYEYEGEWNINKQDTTSAFGVPISLVEQATDTLLADNNYWNRLGTVKWGGDNNMSKFGVGDAVLCVENPLGRKTAKGAGWKKGLVFEVTSIVPHISPGNCYFAGCRGNGVYEDFLKPIKVNKNLNGKEVAKMTNDKAVTVRKTVAEVYGGTKDAMVVEEYIGLEIGNDYLSILNLKANRKEVLEEAYRRQTEDKKALEKAG